MRKVLLLSSTVKSQLSTWYAEKIPPSATKKYFKTTLLKISIKICFFSKKLEKEQFLKKLVFFTTIWKFWNKERRVLRLLNVTFLSCIVPLSAANRGPV
jgi:hypothetical protein